MRNRRLLTLAVLAVAIGFSAYAQAGDNTDPYGIAVLTVIQDPNVGGVQTGTFNINIRIWGDGGVGTTAETPGLLDFVIKDITGTGGATVTGVSIIAPIGIVSDLGIEDPNYGGGFSDRDKRGIRYAGPNFDITKTIIPNSFNAVGFQPVAYDANGTIAPLGPNTLRDAAILYGVGTLGRNTAVDANTQNHSVYANGTWLSDPGDFVGDTPIIAGTYDDTGGIAVTTWGVESFDVLPGTPGSVFVGPAVDANTFGRPVKAVLIQTTTGFGNEGGKNASANPITLRVAAGNVILGSASTLSGTNVTLLVSEPNTSVTIGSATGSKTFAALDLTPNPDLPGGFRGVDVSATRVDIYSADPVDTADTLRALRTVYAGPTTNGLYSSQLNPADANQVLVVTAVDAGNDSTYDYVSVKATVNGDVNLDGKADFLDLIAMTDSWQAAENQWADGDINNDFKVDFLDLIQLTDHWQQTFLAPGPLPAPAVPEPATMSLLCLGALGLLRRHRRN